MHRRQDEAIRSTASPPDLLVTGASGFLGSQFVTEWLQRHPSAQVGCLVRAADAGTARSRLRTALIRAGEDRAVGDTISALLPRAVAIRGEIGQTDWLVAARQWHTAVGRGPFQILHCAANLSFRTADRDAVRAINIDGTRAMLEAAVTLGASEFNYVSTAYVAGDRDGDILEDEVDAAPGFSNAYEESKWEAEALVRCTCAAIGLPYRILRPSIIIGHSVTHRLSALSGFYKVIETMMTMGRNPRIQGQHIRLPLPLEATLDLIPVDVVVAEMIGVLEAGEASLGHTFHITSDNPLPLVDMFTQLSPLAGLTIGRQNDSGEPASPVAEMMIQRLRHYMPYLGQVRRFDRRNVREAGIASQEAIDVTQLHRYVSSFIAEAA